MRARPTIVGLALFLKTGRRNTMKHTINRLLPDFVYLMEVGEDSA